MCEHSEDRINCSSSSDKAEGFVGTWQELGRITEGGIISRVRGRVREILNRSMGRDLWSRKWSGRVGKFQGSIGYPSPRHFSRLIHLPGRTWMRLRSAAENVILRKKKKEEKKVKPDCGRETPETVSRLSRIWKRASNISRNILHGRRPYLLFFSISYFKAGFETSSYNQPSTLLKRNTRL